MKLNMSGRSGRKYNHPLQWKAPEREWACVLCGLTSRKLEAVDARNELANVGCNPLLLVRENFGNS